MTVCAIQSERHFYFLLLMLEISLGVLWDFTNTDPQIHRQIHRYTHTNTWVHRHRHAYTYTPHVYSQKVIGKPSIVRTSVGLLSQPLMLPSVQYISSSQQMMENLNVCLFLTPPYPASKLNMCFFSPGVLLCFSFLLFP